MTPDERQLISDLFDRMRQQGPIDKDREAEALIRDMIRQMPDTPYMMVQTVLVQEMALQNTQAQVEELQDRVQALEAAAARPQNQGQGGSSFLGGLLGGGARSSGSGSVPSVGRPSQPAGFTGTRSGAAGSPWGGASDAAPQSPLGRATAQQQPIQQGGGFMRSALTTAAGVAGGMLAANAISSMFKGDTAHASQPAADQSSVAGQTDQAQDTDSSHGDDYSGDDELGYDDGGDWDLE